MVYQELSVVHAGEQLNVCIGVKSTQMPGLRLCYKSFFGSIPIMNIGPLNRLQFVSIDILVSITNCLPFAIGPYFPAFVQKNVEVMGMEKPFPEAGPVVTGPDIKALIVAKGIHQPFGQWQ